MTKQSTAILWLDQFADDWADLGLSLETDLWRLETELLRRPEAGDRVVGACGLRKYRFAPAGRDKGKSGSVRIGYVYLQGVNFLILAMAYGKNYKDTLTADDKKAICKMLRFIEKRLAMNEQQKHLGN
jgi:hypothetical protein